MAIWLRTHAIQVLIGIALAVLPLFYFTYTDVSWQPLSPHDHVIQNGLAYLFLLLFSYVNHTVFVPRWFLAKQYRRYLIVAVSCILVVAYLPYRIEQWFYFKPPPENTPLAWVRQIFVAEMMLERPPGRPFRERTGEPLRPAGPNSTGEMPSSPVPARNGHPPDRQNGRPPRRPPFSAPLSAKLAIFFLLGSVSTLASISLQTANRLRRVENDQLQAELRQLKAQIHPHFLFNTLNSIYALAIRNDARTADTIVKLAEFMRYMIRDAHRDKVSLATEISYLTNYIDLQKARLQEAVQVDYQLAGNVNRWQIAPLLLFSFIENAFKYGVNPEEDSPIAIRIRIQDNELRLHVANNKVPVSRLDESTGIGLQNARDRLSLLYPAAHTLTIDDAPTHYRVDLTLLLTA